MNKHRDLLCRILEIPDKRRLNVGKSGKHNSLNPFNAATGINSRPARFETGYKTLSLQSGKKQPLQLCNVLPPILLRVALYLLRKNRTLT